MKTIEIKLYQFNELSEKAQENAIQNYKESCADYDWYEPTLDMFSSQFGIVIKSFDLYKEEIELDFKYNLDEICKSFVYEFNNNSIAELAKNYLRSVDAQLSLGIDDDMMEDMEALFIKDLEEEILSWLDNEYEYLQSEEYIVQTIEDNGYEFTEDGKVY
jgi:hypothetical protein